MIIQTRGSIQKVVMKHVVIISLLVLSVGFLLGCRSGTGNPPGLINGKLSRCPGSPNCVSSEYAADTGHYLAPVPVPRDFRERIMPVITSVLSGMGGRIQEQTDTYVAATFSSTVFRFIDDVEIRIDPEENQIHFRSGSRIGYSDFGVNRKRIEQFRALLDTAFKQAE